MGCLCTKNQNKEIVSEQLVQDKIYSWDNKKNVNTENFILENLSDREVLKLPGSVNGQQFIIQNCKDSIIYILDHINTITIDDCNNCKIILGPVKGSTFIRNCVSCTCVLACGQFRMRDCTKVNVFLFSATQPIIEASSEIYFGSYQLQYNGIQEHFQKCNLNFGPKNWNFIFDFTPMECEKNWYFLKNVSISRYIPESRSDILKNALINLGYGWSDIKESKSPTENKR